MGTRVCIVGLTLDRAVEITCMHLPPSPSCFLAVQRSGSGRSPPAATPLLRATQQGTRVPSDPSVQPRVVTFSAEDMCLLWSHQEPNGNVTNLPYVQEHIYVPVPHMFSLQYNLWCA